MSYWAISVHWFLALPKSIHLVQVESEGLSDFIMSIILILGGLGSRPAWGTWRCVRLWSRLGVNSVSGTLFNWWLEQGFIPWLLERSSLSCELVSRSSHYGSCRSLIWPGGGGEFVYICIWFFLQRNLHLGRTVSRPDMSKPLLSSKYVLLTFLSQPICRVSQSAFHRSFSDSFVYSQVYCVRILISNHVFSVERG